jgi:hypothetical protein
VDDDDDDSFLQAFEACTLPKDRFSHRDHVRLAWLCLGRQPFEEAARRVSDGIRRFAAFHGLTGLYHETITRAWLHVIAAARREPPPAATFAAFLEAHPGLGAKGALDPYYSPGTLLSEAARSRFVPPDRAPLP